MEGERLRDGRREPRLADTVAALIARQHEVGGRLRVVRLRRHVAAARLDRLERDRAIRADKRAGRALHVELRASDRRDVALQEFGLAAAVSYTHLRAHE